MIPFLLGVLVGFVVACLALVGLAACDLWFHQRESYR